MYFTKSFYSYSLLNILRYSLKLNHPITKSSILSNTYPHDETCFTQGNKLILSNIYMYAYMYHIDDSIM